MKENPVRICGIYCIYNEKYFYVGLSRDIRRRWKQHQYELKNNKHCNPILQQVYNKFSQNDPLCYKIICECEEKYLGILEIKVKKKLSNKYPNKICMNIAECGGERIFSKGTKFTEEHKRKISEGQLGIKHPSMWRKVVQLSMDGEFIKVWDSISIIKEKIGIEVRLDYQSNGGFQWQYYEDWIKNPKGKLLYKQNTSVIQYDKQGNFIARYESIGKASKITGIRRGDISNTIHNRQKSAGGFIWKMEK